MSEASFWLSICGRRLGEAPSIEADLWCKRTLSEAAASTPQPAGRDGFVWHFVDGSRLLLNSDVAVVL